MKSLVFAMAMGSVLSVRYRFLLPTRSLRSVGISFTTGLEGVKQQTGCQAV